MSSAGTSVAGDRLEPLDGLRGVAIALVLWFHVWQITWLRADVHGLGRTFNFNAIPEAGFVGVDLFFFISGFCLFVPYARARFDGRPRPALATFVARRARKILPSYYVSLALVVALGAAHFGSARDALVQIVAHATFVHVFDDATYGGINGVLWSLAIEVQFYVVFPLVAWCATRAPALVCASLAGGALAYRLAVAPHEDAAHQMEQLPGTLDLFAAGIFTAHAYRALATRAPQLAGRRSLWTALACAGAVASAWTLQSAYDARFTSGWPGLWEVWGRSAMSFAFAALTLGSLFAARMWQRALANPALLFLSGISYNLYLWHQVVARALRDARVPGWRPADPHADATWALALTGMSFVAAIAVAWLATALVERPFLGRTRVRSGRSGNDCSRAVISSRAAAFLKGSNDG
ncbi:MAG: acyltransferase [Vulcanimicrobiaceae bacterium]